LVFLENDEAPDKLLNTFDIANLRETFKNHGFVVKADFVAKDQRFLKMKRSLFI